MNVDKSIQKRIKMDAKKKSSKKYHTFDNGKYRFRFWFMFPLVLVVKAIVDHRDKEYNALVWTDERATKVLDDVFPMTCDIDKDNEVSFCRDWDRCLQSVARGKNKKFCGKFEYQLKEFIEEKYEISGYTKRVEDMGYGEVWTIFKRNEN